jgi:hypothetical protein
VVITWKSGAKLLVTTTAPPGARASLHSLIIITCHTQIHYSFVYLKKRFCSFYVRITAIAPAERDMGLVVWPGDTGTHPPREFRSSQETMHEEFTWLTTSSSCLNLFACVSIGIISASGSEEEGNTAADGGDDVVARARGAIQRIGQRPVRSNDHVGDSKANERRSEISRHVRS